MENGAERDLLVIIPAFNEGNNIGDVINRIRSESGESIDVLVVDDGSTDNTVVFSREAGAFVLELPVNLGYGAALQAGYAYALEHGYDVVVQLDADGQHDPVSITDLVRPIMEGNYMVVIGSRFLGESLYRVPMLRRIGQMLFGSILFALSRKRITDPTSGYQAIHRDVLEMYISEEFPADYPDADVLLLLHYCGIPFCEVPAVFHARTDGQSMHSGLNTFYYIYKMLLSMFIVTCRRVMPVSGYIRKEIEK